MKTKGMAVFAALLIAMMTVGVGYALWSESLWVDVWVETGDIDLDLEVFGFGADDDYKEISTIDAWVDGDYLYIEIYDAYPCVWYWVHFDVQAMGSVPTHMKFIGGPPADFPGTSYLEMRADFVEPYQMHYGDTECVMFWVHFDNTAEQSTVYQFQWELYYWQYNEEPGK